MKDTKIQNAKIESTILGYEYHNILTCSLMLDYGDSGHQGFGGYGLDEPKNDENGKFIKRVGTAYGLEFIKQILDVVGVKKWEDLVGKHVRVTFTDEMSGFGNRIRAIGNILEDKWFDPEELSKEFGYKKEKK